MQPFERNGDSVAVDGTAWPAGYALAAAAKRSQADLPQMEVDGHTISSTVMKKVSTSSSSGGSHLIDP